MTTKLNLTQAVNAARAVTAARLELEQQTDLHKLHGPFDADFTKRWFSEIVKAAALGMTAWSIPVAFPRPAFPALYRAAREKRRAMIIKTVDAFLEGSGLRATYADWHLGTPISVRVQVSWRSTGRA